MLADRAPPLLTGLPRACVRACCSRSFGITGRLQTNKIGMLSEGQKSRLIFAMMCMKNHNMLLMDEPTNHLDIEAIDSLAGARERASWLGAHTAGRTHAGAQPRTRASRRRMQSPAAMGSPACSGCRC